LTGEVIAEVGHDQSIDVRVVERLSHLLRHVFGCHVESFDALISYTQIRT
jgi:hypothetical protein